MRERLEKYNVTWDSPSQDSSGSMPLGNGDLGANVWVEPNGDVVVLLAKTDAWDENASLLKLGRVRLKITPNPLTKDRHFRQTLETADRRDWRSPLELGCDQTPHLGGCESSGLADRGYRRVAVRD